MARRKRKGSRKRARPQILPLAGVAIGGYTVAKAAMDAQAAGKSPADYAVLRLTGIRIGDAYEATGKRVDMAQVLPFYGPIVGSIVAHKVLNKLGVNKYLGKLPFGL